jgi:hypothetical protein
VDFDVTTPCSMTSAQARRGERDAILRHRRDIRIGSVSSERDAGAAVELEVDVKYIGHLRPVGCC